ncbi:uncharacterized protein EI90DRAFT_1915742 [Cantharellus anzutake]|uniref:uncharacterized protein n=1 Tax=Cantharellus anzutake TaxID=1750568 RepID=UPI0019078E2E|nr:uncharacterized protein EI90DRAFT_1915742 [Cantharellus anzutake]KAF8326635.1 hypothetical protein EI90DRAFT_1915742 [Cantharellus anzutake]
MSYPIFERSPRCFAGWFLCFAAIGLTAWAPNSSTKGTVSSASAPMSGLDAPGLSGDSVEGLRLEEYGTKA